MTLEGFFTSTELKDGLTTPTRVNELVTVMQNEKEFVVKNVGEATRQWSAVATTIATTENKDCLDLFIQLDGLWFIDRWLNDAQKLVNESENRFLEELIVALLRALDKLQVDNQRSVSSGIDKTVQGLLGHSSSMVREKAKAICDGWAPAVQDIDAAPKDVEMIEAIGDGPECPPVAVSNEEKMEESSEQKILNAEIPTQDATMESPKTDHDPVDSLTNVSGNVAVMVESEKSKSESTVLTGVSGSTPTVQSDISQMDKHVEDAKEKQEIDSLDKTGEVESTTVSSPSEDKSKTPPENADIEKTSEPDKKTEKREEDTSDKDEDMLDGGGDSSGGALEVSENNKWGEADDPKTTSETESDEEDAKKYVGTHSDDDSGNRTSRFSKRSMKGQDGDLISKRPSDMELDYGMVDPLELARQVANEVEREVDSRERSCSTSQNVSGSGIERPSSPDSVKEPESFMGPGKEVSSGSGPKGSPSAAEPVNDVEKLASEMTSCEPDVPETRVSEMAQESGAIAEKGFSGFDLNQEFSSEETECRADPVLTPVSVVSASRAAAAVDGLPVAPLQFEGALGWKGSAATSAFRRIPEVEKAVSHSNSKQHLDRLDFDLNVTEGGEDVTDDLLSRDKMPITSFLEPSAEEPRRLERLELDLNSLGDGDTGAIALDWKRDGRVASLRQNGPQSPALSSSSSSMQPSFRNIDLNLNDHHSTVPNNASSDNPFLGKLFNNSNVSGGGSYKRDESVISIFGTQVEVKRKDPVSAPNGRILDPPVDFSLGRTGSGLGLGPSMPYPNLPAYGHNGFTLGPAMSFSTPMYVPPGGPIGPIGQIGQISQIPYMVDSRGAPIVPQLMGSSSSSSIPPPFSQPTQPFIFNMAATGAPSGSNGAGPSRHNFDLNSGFMTDGGNRENNNGGLRQFLSHGQVRPVDEQQFLRMSNSLQGSSSSVIGGKRQEPEGGWESFPINYKHHQQPPPPWQ